MTGIVQVCFQHNINFPFYKKPYEEASCPYSLIGTLWRASEAPEERVPAGSGLPGSPPLPPWKDNTLDSYALLPLNLSAAPTHHSTGMSYCWTDQSSGTALFASVVQECVCEQERKIPLPRGVYIYNINTPLHTSTYVTSLWLFTPSHISTSATDVIHSTYSICWLLYDRKKTYTHLVSCKQTVKSAVIINLWYVCLCRSVRPDLRHFKLHVNLHLSVKASSWWG